MEQVLASDPELVLCFRLAGVLQFYVTALSNIAGETATISVVVADLRAATLKACFDALSVHAGSLLAKVDLPPVMGALSLRDSQTDLSPPSSVESTLEMLRDVLSSQDAPGTSADVQRAELTKVAVIFLF